ncbi:hypothetical protein DFP73DRAFT_176129 [Morchella snyderi]|nr:hypothetical protein DFP73DRAFT_176129 [Morchella snyderi]
MHITPPLTSIPTLLLLLLLLHLPVQTSATPHPQLIAPTMLDEPSRGAQQCRDMEAAMNDCFGGAPYMLKGLVLDEAAMRACVCASGGFTAATILVLAVAIAGVSCVWGFFLLRGGLWELSVHVDSDNDIMQPEIAHVTPPGH